MNFNGIKIGKANFKVSDVFSYEGTVQLWDKNTSIALDFPKDKPEDEYFDILAEKITEQIKWIEENREKIEKALIDYGCISLAEDWASSAEKADDEEQECYIMEDGQKVFFPISEEEFLNSLYFESISIDFRSDTENPEIELFISCSPDYFAYHVLHVSADSEKNVKCRGLAG